MNEDSHTLVDFEETPSARQAADVAGWWSSFIAAVQFLTRLPVGRAAAPSVAALNRCALFFPLVGALIGLFTAAVLGAGCWLWPMWLAVILALTAEACLTGAFHEDALADFFDAFGGGWTREDVLRILKDSRVGTYGAIALLLGVALRAAAMMAIVQQSGLENWTIWGSAIVASSAIGRWVIVLTLVGIRPVSQSDASLSRDIGARMGWRDLCYSSVLCLPAVAPFALLMPMQFLLAILLLVPAIWTLWRSIRRKLGGVTGDCLGCACYISQVLVLLAAAAKFEL